jgi:hypothetical protein
VTVGISISLRWTVLETVGVPFPHGQQRGWGRGCRCDRCRQADLAYQRSRRAKRRPGPQPFHMPSCLWACTLCHVCLDDLPLTAWRSYPWKGVIRRVCQPCERYARERIQRELEKRHHYQARKRQDA